MVAIVLGILKIIGILLLIILGLILFVLFSVLACAGPVSGGGQHL